MYLQLTVLVLTGMLLAGRGLGAGNVEAHPAGGAPEVSGAPLAITLPPGFITSVKVSGLTAPRGVAAFPPLDNFPCCIFVVEQSLNRVARSDGGPPVAFATGLYGPTDLRPAPGGGSGPFGNFLYVPETGVVFGTGHISRIGNTGVVFATFATLPAAPKRLAFSPDPGAFGTFLFVTLANGQLVKVDPSGTVSACASGLSGPEGLVFGPGGAVFKNVLFVAEATANRISKVTPDCTVTPFATTGLSAPTGLTISPGGAWGPPDTLYVTNAGTRVDRVDKTGTVKPFAAGFTQADTVRFRVFGAALADRLGTNATLHVADAAGGVALQGTLSAVFIDAPFLTTQLTGCNPCRAGDPFAVTITLANPSPLALPVEVKAGFRLTDGTPINVSPLQNKHFEVVLPAGLPSTTIPWLSFALPVTPAGRYCYEVGLGEVEVYDSFIASDRACFTVLP